MLALILLLLIPVGLTSIYVHYFIKRFLQVFFHIELNKRKNRLLYLITFLLSLPAINVFGLYAILYFHLLAISAVLEVFNLVLSRFKWCRLGFTSGIFSVLILVAILVFGYYNINHVEETDYKLSSDKVSGLKVLQITDLHMGNAIDTKKLTAYCDKMSKLDPDIVVLTGDIVDERTSANDMKAACSQLSKISNKKGIYYVFGNHDPATYARNSEFNKQEVYNELTKCGIHVLEDEAVTVDNITIVGRKDVRIDSDRKSSDELLRDVKKENYIILLDHQPRDLEKNASLHVDLQLSGHTHGGQLFPLREFQNLVTNILVYGQRNIGNFTAITSSGISAWGYPLRTEGKSEYVLITIE